MLQPLPYDDLHLFNSLTRRVERFVPRADRTVSIYVCGITPYDVGHLGHALVYVAFDTLRRWLEFYERPVQAEFSNRLVGVFEDAMRDVGEAEREQTRMIFVRSLQHQVEVFDAAWRLSDEWRVE